jgi:hypothetical protein
LFAKSVHTPSPENGARGPQARVAPRMARPGDLAAARGDWTQAVRLFLTNADHTRSPGLKGMFLRFIAIALAHLGADEDALELAATANAICESIGEALGDPLTTRYGQALDDARERLGAERAAHAAPRVAARHSPRPKAWTRAAEMVRRPASPERRESDAPAAMPVGLGGNA